MSKKFSHYSSDVNPLKLFLDPSDTATVNSGTPIDNDAITDIKDNSLYLNHCTQPTAIKQPKWKTGGFMNFDGGDCLNTDCWQEMSNATQGYISGWVRPTSIAERYPIAFGNSSSFVWIIFRMLANRKFEVYMYDGTSNSWIISTNGIAFTNNVWTHFALYHDGTKPYIEIDNVAVAQTITTATNQNYWFANAPGINNCRIGCRDVSLGDQFFWLGDIQQIRVRNDVPSPAERTAIYNTNQP